jgi:DNA-directed RNA polymerase specialized sigma24 family protein
MPSAFIPDSTGQKSDFCIQSRAVMRQALDELIAREACAEILSLLQPEERVIAALRVQGFDDGQIAETLGLDRSTVCRRMLRAQQRIAEQRPDLAGLLAGRRRSSGLRPSGAPADDAGHGPDPGAEHRRRYTC